MKRLSTAVACAAALAAAFVVGQLTGTRPAAASAAHVYTLRMGDKVSIPAINQACTVSAEGGATDLFCARARGAHHQVVFYRDNILVWTVGNPDNAAWHGKP